MKLFRNKIAALIVLSSVTCLILVAAIALMTSISHRKIYETQRIEQSNSLRLSIELQARQQDRFLKSLAAMGGLEPCRLLNDSSAIDTQSIFSLNYVLFIAVTDPDLVPVKLFPAPEQGVLELLPDDHKAFRQFRSEGHITRYYAWYHESLVRVQAVDIPWCRSANAGGGILFAGFPVSAQELSFLVQGKAVLIREPLEKKAGNEMQMGIVSTELPLVGWRNLPVASLSLETTSDLLRGLSRYRNRLILLLIVIGLISILLLSVYLIRHFAWPMKMLNLAIRLKDPEYLQQVDSGDTDIKAMHNLILDAFSQEKLLSEIVRRRSVENLNAFHAAILSQIPDAVYSTDRNGIITYWSRTAAELYNVSEEDAIGAVADELIQSKWISKDEHARQKTHFENDGLMHGKMLQERPDGTELSVEASVTRLLDCNGRELGQLYIARKI